jgi:uncharacterized protein (TIGR02145 family)
MVKQIILNHIKQLGEKWIFFNRFLIVVIFITSCNINSSNVSNPGDISSNLDEVIIGSQVWASKNLDVSTFRDGDPIPEAKTKEEWVLASNNKQPTWCYYNYDPFFGKKYGKLYNWYAVKDPRGLAPNGWKIPTQSEWRELINFLGGEQNAGTKLKSTEGWLEGRNGLNSSGFSGFPGGFCNIDGYTSGLGNYGDWWSSTERSEDLAWVVPLTKAGESAFITGLEKRRGHSVRCIRD